MIDFDSIRRTYSLVSAASRHTRLRRSGNEWVGLCPFHRERSPSFTIFDDESRFHCFGCGASGDVIDFMRDIDGTNLTDAAARLPGPIGQRIAAPPLSLSASVDRRAEALAIWNRAVPATGTLAEAYLRWRGITIPCPDAIRFINLPYGQTLPMPCLVAAIRNATGDVIGIQRIWLAPDGKGKADLPKPKLSLGRIRGGAIQLSALNDTGVLVVCEGPEDGLSLLQMMQCPVWVAAGATLLPGMQFPPAVKTIVIGADNDSAGMAAVAHATAAFNARGLSVRVIRPLTGFKDFNDELRGAL